MERKRNRPEKYNRVLVQKSVKAMKKILDIRKARQDRFYENRFVNALWSRKHDFYQCRRLEKILHCAPTCSDKKLDNNLKTLKHVEHRSVQFVCHSLCFMTLFLFHVLLIGRARTYDALLLTPQRVAQKIPPLPENKVS